MNEYVSSVTERGIWAIDVRPEWEAAQYKFGLCPVTRNLIRRFLLLEQEEPNEARSAEVAPSPAGMSSSPGIPEVFLSFASEDLPLAQQVFTFLRRSGRQVFFSHETLNQTNFGDAIDNALAAAKSLVVVGTESERFFKPWVRYEWQSFHNDILSRRKPWETPLITLAAKPADRNALPRPLAFREVVECDPTSPSPAIQRVHSLLARSAQ